MRRHRSRTACSLFPVLVVCALAEPAYSDSRWWVAGWAAPHVASDWGSPEAIFRDPACGEMLMCDPRLGRVRVFDSNGVERFAFRTQLQDKVSSLPMRGEPRSVIILPSGLVYLVDRVSAVVTIHNYRGDLVGELDLAADLGVEPRALRAEQLALGPCGRIYISTSGSATGVAVYDQRDSLVATVGYNLEGYQKPVQPGALAVDARGGIWLAELRGFPVIRHYDSTGRYAGGFAGRDAGPKDLSFASAILCAADGSLWVSDPIRQVVKHFTPDGEFIEMIGGYGVQPGELQYPTGLAGDGVREVFVCEREGRRIQRFYLPQDETGRSPGGEDEAQRVEAVP